ncbi:transcriptional regulator [Niastella yeongjuensis]|uniref:Transcriptional regulator n=1 Tax=Niastella yeongjuensis TaxID=354355 RepID=A0A1V9EUY2_9BACT|nr:winged helix-turn-helix domain-containing protein [Niastella yeongjuensis]OQP49832.1 transcriptional regulator [Niastella yeongjuensis]SEP40251.1 DNA-binding transcriptional regulator, ArsR family [Niastella yeongjuensis]
MDSQFGNITSLIGDPIRSIVLWTLLDGRAYTATELAICADTSAQNISMHLSKLVRADLLTVESQGRHRYYRFSRQEVAYAIEALANLISHKDQVKETAIDISDIKYCRTCYDHLAGRVGVLVTEKLIAQKIIELQNKVYTLTTKGDKFFRDFGIDVNELKNKRRLFARPCLDWSERKYHLSGSLGAALLNEMLQADWLRRKKNSRAIVITSKGQAGLYSKFKIS